MTTSLLKLLLTLKLCLLKHKVSLFLTLKGCLPLSLDEDEGRGDG
jgi:hypothetical protein